jgi:acetyl esterase/lipase
MIHLTCGQELEIFPNEPYGPDPQHVMDIYLPPGRNTSVTKVILLIHGGGWSGGNKEDMNAWVNFFYNQFNAKLAKYAIANMAYRFGSIGNPGFPKQVQDVELAINFLKSKENVYLINPTFGLAGVSAGAHLSMLYGFSHNASQEVSVICNLVGPSSLVDPSYTEDRNMDWLFYLLVGNYTFAQEPFLYYLASPIAYINSQSPKTISFYGDSDELIPSTQGAILEDKLDQFGIYNKFYLYQGAGHGNFTAEQYTHMYTKMTYFFNNYM